MKRLTREQYPRCPLCGGPVAGAMMTSSSVELRFGVDDPTRYYHPDALSVYCVSGSCNWQAMLGQLTTPVPSAEPKP